jgi:hypothetical protein
VLDLLLLLLLCALTLRLLRLFLLGTAAAATVIQGVVLGSSVCSMEASTLDLDFSIALDVSRTFLSLWYRIFWLSVGFGD